MGTCYDQLEVRTPRAFGQHVQRYGSHTWLWCMCFVVLQVAVVPVCFGAVCRVLAFHAWVGPGSCFCFRFLVAAPAACFGLVLCCLVRPVCAVNTNTSKVDMVIDVQQHGLGQQWQWLCRLYVAQNPACTHGYALRNHTVASALLRELGHDVAAPVDIVMACILNALRAQLPSFVMLPPPISQLYRTGKHKACSPVHVLLRPHMLLLANVHTHKCMASLRTQLVQGWGRSFCTAQASIMCIRC
jgi:hypothetical protein